MKIRETRIPGNQGGRCGCQFRSPYSGQTYYATVESGHLTLRDWGGGQFSQEPTLVTIAANQLTAHFVSEREVCVTVAGFHANSDDSATETFVLPVEVGR